MRYLWYGFLGLFSIGFFGAIIAVIGFVYILNYYGKDLPDYTQLRNYEPPIVSRVYAGDGRLISEFAQEKRIFVPAEFIPAHLKQAFIAAEDQNYYKHSGVDLTAVARAMLKNVRNKLIGNRRRPEGGSTITQQVAKNFFFDSEVSYERKLKEAIIAYRMSKTLGRDKVLELYLNQILLGGSVYGVGAASLHYFDKSLDQLNIAEAAYLAALPKAPNNYHPVRNHDAALARRNWVIGRMEVEGYITEAQAELAKLYPLEMKSRDIEKVDAPYFAEEVRRELVSNYGEDSLYQGGLAVRASVNPALQLIAEKALQDGLQAYDRRHGYRGVVARLDSMDDWRMKLADIAPQKGMLEDWVLAAVLDVSADNIALGFVEAEQGILDQESLTWIGETQFEIGDIIMVSPVQDNAAGHTYMLQQAPKIQGALIALDPHTGRVLAMQGGWQYTPRVSEFNRATQAQRQPGSAFKPFVYLAALDKGFTPATLVLDAPFVLEDKISGTWRPSNYSNTYYGPTTLRVGIEKSRNLMTVRLADFLGMDLVSKYANHFGITDNMPPLLANSLGAGETTLLRMTAAYGMLVNGGKQIKPTFIDRVQDRYGSTIFKHNQRDCTACGDLIKWEDQAVPRIPDNRKQIADPRTAYQMVHIMEGVVQRGTAARLRSLNRPLAGKTGTTNEVRDAWFVGFSPNLVVGVYIGFDTPQPLGRGESGSSAALPVFKSFMQEALADQPAVPFRRPAGIKSMRINAKTGALARPSDENVIWESFIAGAEPTDQMYMLGEEGITVFDAYDHAQYDYEGYFDSFQGDSAVDLAPSSSRRQDVIVPTVNTGTGGLY